MPSNIERMSTNQLLAFSAKLDREARKHCVREEDHKRDLRDKVTRTLRNRGFLPIRAWKNHSCKGVDVQR